MIDLILSVDLSNIFNILPWLIPFGIVGILNEWVDRKTDWPREVHRKIGHVVSGLTIIFASLYLDQAEMIMFGIFIFIGAIGTRILRIGSVHNVVRKSLGTSLFPLSVIILAYFFGENDMELLRYGILILTISDAAAAVIGSAWGKQIPWFNKSFLGSFVFFVGTFGVTLFYVESLFYVLMITVVLTIIEFLSQWGVDNLLMPLAGSGMIYFLVM